MTAVLSHRYSGVKFNQGDMRVKLGDIVLMDKGQPLEFDKSAASSYLESVTSKHDTVYIDVQVGSGGGHGIAWGCDLSYESVAISLPLWFASVVSRQ